MTNINNSTGPNGKAPLAMMSEAIDHADTASPKTYRQNHHWLRLRVVWRFTRHLLEMVIAMVSGMAVLGAAIAALGEPRGYSNLFVEYGMMVVSMSAPMVAWMRYRGHSWLDGLEMTAAMLFPTFALVLPMELGVAVPGVSEGSLMMLSHVAMIAGMVALMVYRLDRYAHGTHGRHV